MQRTILTLSLIAGVFLAGSSFAENVKNKGAAVVDQHGGCIHTKWSDDEGCGGLIPSKVEKPIVKGDTEKAATKGDGAQMGEEARSVYFDFGKSNLTADSRKKLDDAVSFIKDHNVKALEIVGYTDAIGSSAYNDALSKRRADTVRDYLARRAKIASTTSVRGLGAASSQSDCGDDLSRNARIACLAKDRRVEIELRYE